MDYRFDEIYSKYSMSLIKLLVYYTLITLLWILTLKLEGTSFYDWEDFILPFDKSYITSTISYETEYHSVCMYTRKL